MSCFALLLSLTLSSVPARAEEKAVGKPDFLLKQADSSKRRPTAMNMREVMGQVQLCPGTEALGNEGQGMAAVALVNYSYAAPNGAYGAPKIRTCEMALSYAYEYGNDTGYFGMFSVDSGVPVGKTVCTVTEEQGRIFMTVTKAPRKNARSNKPPTILVQKCELTPNGLPR